MTDDATDTGLEETLEQHELAVKRALESLGALERTFQEGVESSSKEELSRLEPVGRALEVHVDRLESVVTTLDDHKALIREDDGVSATYTDALERARQQARYDDSTDDVND